MPPSNDREIEIKFSIVESNPNSLSHWSSGLALLAQHLPAVNPDTFHFPSLDRFEPGSKYYYCEDQSDADWVKIDYELYEVRTGGIAARRTNMIQ